MHLTQVQIDYIKEIAAASMAAVFKVWLKNGRRESAEELYDLLNMAEHPF